MKYLHRNIIILNCRDLLLLINDYSNKFLHIDLSLQNVMLLWNPNVLHLQPSTSSFFTINLDDCTLALVETILINFRWPKEHTFDVSRPSCLEAAKIRDTQKYLKISKL